MVNINDWRVLRRKGKTYRFAKVLLCKHVSMVLWIDVIKVTQTNKLFVYATIGFQALTSNTDLEVLRQNLPKQ